MALDDQLLLAVTTSVASATFLIGFLGNQFHRTLDFARTAAARDDEEALNASGAGLSAILERQEHELESAHTGPPLDWVWLAVIVAIAVAATALAVAAAVVPEGPVSSSAVWTAATLIALTWLIVSAAAWDWHRTARELVRVRRSTYASALRELRSHLVGWQKAMDGDGGADRASRREADAVRHRVAATHMAHLLTTRLPRAEESPLAAVAHAWAACAFIAQTDDIAGGRMTGEETAIDNRSETGDFTMVSKRATDALAELWESVSALADSASPTLLTAAAWAAETARGLDPPPANPQAMPAEWEVTCLAEASRRRHAPALRLDSLSRQPVEPIMPSWRVYDRALRSRPADPGDLNTALHLLDQLVHQVDSIERDEDPAEARSAVIEHIRNLIPKVIESGPRGTEIARAYLWKWPFVTTPPAKALPESWLYPVAWELRHEHLSAEPS